MIHLKDWFGRRFAAKVRGWFKLPPIPFSGTSEEWDQFQSDSESVSKVIHYLTHDMIISIEYCVYRASGLHHTIRHKLYPIRNIWKFRKALIMHRNWDYSGMLAFMEIAARDMEVAHTSSPKKAKSLKILAELLERVSRDDYMDDKIQFDHIDGKLSLSITQRPDQLPSSRNRLLFYKMVERQKELELEEAMRLIRKHILTWWT